MHRLSLAAGFMTVLALMTPALSDVLNGTEIKGTVSGKRIFLATPPYGEFPLYYRTNGIVDGTGEALGLGRFMAPTDQGRWWVEGGRLCQKWQEWYKGKTFCFTIARVDAERIRWTRDDGYSGMARIGN